MLKSIKSNNSPGHLHNGHSSVVGLSFDSCPGNISKEDNKMKIKMNKLVDMIKDAINEKYEKHTIEIVVGDVWIDFGQRWMDRQIVIFYGKRENPKYRKGMNRFQLLAPRDVVAMNDGDGISLAWAKKYVNDVFKMYNMFGKDLKEDK